MTELHLHLDGSLRPKTVWELGKEQNIDLGAKDIEELKFMMEVPNDCKTLHECLERFDLPLKVLQTADAIERVSYEIVEDLSKLGIDYAEVRFAPQLSINKGLTQSEVVEAAIKGVKRGMKDFPTIKCGLILCCMRGENIQDKNLETIEVAKKYLGDIVCAVDLAGAESLYSTEIFETVFKKANEYNLPRTIHAGEAAGADSIRKALSYGTKRLGHGVNAIYDKELMKELIDNEVTLEVCVTSNYQTKVVQSIEEHPVKKLFDAGVRVTVNSDNMTVSSTNIHKEIKILKERLGFTDEDIKKMQEYAEEARFLK